MDANWLFAVRPSSKSSSVARPAAVSTSVSSHDTLRVRRSTYLAQCVGYMTAFCRQPQALRPVLRLKPTCEGALIATVGA